MKGAELKKILRENGCRIYREGKNHEVWISPATGNKFTVPRHSGQEVPTGTVKSIMRSAGIK